MWYKQENSEGERTILYVTEVCVLVTSALQLYRYSYLHIGMYNSVLQRDKTLSGLCTMKQLFSKDDGKLKTQKWKDID